MLTFLVDSIMPQFGGVLHLGLGEARDVVEAGQALRAMLRVLQTHKGRAPAGAVQERKRAENQIINIYIDKKTKMSDEIIFACQYSNLSIHI